MDLFDAVRDRLPGRAGGAAGDRGTFEYRCRDCDAEFASPQRHVTAASCPDCGSEDVRVGEDPY